MDYDAFTAGVGPGGLRSTNDIRILICYLLASVDAPLSQDDMLRVLQDNCLANYFEVTSALADLTENGNLELRDGLYMAGKKGRMIAKQLDTALPLSVREHAVSAALNLLAAARREQENRVEITPTDRGYTVSCHISGGDMELMQFSLYVPDLFQANLVKENFHDAPQDVYRVLLAVVTKNYDLAKEILDPKKKP